MSSTLTQTWKLCLANPPPVDLPMLPANMPYYRGPRVTLPPDEAALEASHIQTLLTELVINSSGWSTTLSIMPVRFGTFDDAELLPVLNSWEMYNVEFASYALQASQFSWAVYNFSDEHFVPAIESANLSFTIRVGCHTTQRSSSLFGEFAPNARIFSTGNDFLNHICSSGDQSVFHGYLTNTFWFRTTKVTKAFWDLQLQIVAQLCLICSTSVVVEIVTPILTGLLHTNLSPDWNELIGWSHAMLRNMLMLAIKWTINASFLQPSTHPVLRRWSLSN